MLLVNSSPHTLYIHDIQDRLLCYERMFEVWNRIAQIPEQFLDLEVDFNYCNFLAHNGVAFLGGLVRLVESRGGRVTFRWNTLRPKIQMNLAQNGFICEFGDHSQPWDGNSIPYRCDRHHDPEALANYLRFKWLGKGWVRISPSAQEAITGQTLEIYLNAFEHSCSEIGVYSCGQHYPEAKQLQLTVVDFGVGIPTRVRSLPQNAAMSSTQALEWAFQPGTSTKYDDVCHGSGLSLLQEFVIKNRGCLKIFSNDGNVTISHNGVRYTDKCTNFSGTLVNIAIHCDESYYCLASEVSEPARAWF